MCVIYYEYIKWLYHYDYPGKPCNLGRVQKLVGHTCQVVANVGAEWNGDPLASRHVAKSNTTLSRGGESSEFRGTRAKRSM